MGQSTGRAKSYGGVAAVAVVALIVSLALNPPVATARPVQADRAALDDNHHRVYVTMIGNFGSYTKTPAQIGAEVDTVLDRWVEEANGHLTSFERAGEVVVYDSQYSACGQGSLITESREQFPGVDFGGQSGNHTLIVAPNGAGCSFGVGSVGGSPLQGGGGLKNGGWVLSGEGSLYQLLLHEFGHNFSLPHARAIACTQPGPSECEVREYANAYSFMGSSGSAKAAPVLGSMDRARLQITDRCELQAAVLPEGRRRQVFTYDLLGRGVDFGTRGLVAIDPTTDKVYSIDWRNRTGRDSEGTYLGQGQRTIYGTGVIVLEADAETLRTTLQPHKVVPVGQAFKSDFSMDPGDQMTIGGVTVRVDASEPGDSTRATSQISIVLEDPEADGSFAVKKQKGQVALRGGRALPGKTMRLKTGGWRGGTCFRYQWFADGKRIEGERHQTLTVPDGLIGKKIRGRVIAQKVGYAQNVASSARKVVGRTFKSSPRPQIKGPARAGATLRIKRGDWNPRPTTWRYRWLADGTRIKGATGRTLKVTKAMKGKRVRAVVVASGDGYVPTERRSPARRIAG